MIIILDISDSCLVQFDRGQEISRHGSSLPTYPNNPEPEEVQHIILQKAGFLYQEFRKFIEAQVVSDEIDIERFTTLKMDTVKIACVIEEGKQSYRRRITDNPYKANDPMLFVWLIGYFIQSMEEK